MVVRTVVGGGSVVDTVVGCGGSDVGTTESVDAGAVDVADAELVGRAVVEEAAVVGPDDVIVVDVSGGPVVVGPVFMANGNGLSGAAIVPSPVDTASRHSAAVAAPRIAPTANLA